MHELIHDIALCIIAAWALGVLAQFLHQPVILAYLVGGFAIGPAGFGLVEGQESVSIISELGLIFLLSFWPFAELILKLWQEQLLFPGCYFYGCSLPQERTQFDHFYF